jgi:hypothetical protein
VKKAAERIVPVNKALSEAGIKGAVRAESAKRLRRAFEEEDHHGTA